MNSAANAPTAALAGVRVVELAHGIAAPFAARLLGDFGADVVKLEGPAGDPLRRDGPAMPGAEHSALFEYLNWNKRGFGWGFAPDEDTSALDALLAGADLLVHGLGPRELRGREDLTPAALRERHPHLCVVAISDFGWTGPHAHWNGSDLVLQAMGGILSFSGLREREPLKPGLRQAYYCAGLNGAYVAMASVLHARRTGSGALLDLSVLEVVASELVSVLPAYSLAGVVAARRSAAQDPLLSGEPLPVADGFVTLQVNPLFGPDKLARVLNEPRLADPTYATQQGRIAAAAELRELLKTCLAHRQGREVFEAVSDAGLLAGVLQDARQLMQCHHLSSREVWVEHQPGDRNPAWKLPAQLARMSATPMAVRRGAPRLGTADNHALLQESGQAARQRGAASPNRPLAADRAPLEGVRVLDLSTVFAAPYIGALLADLGADVIKVEAPKRLDQLRAGGFGYLMDNDPGEAGWNRCSTFQMLNRGKRSVVLDLQTEAGRELLCELVANADVLIENFTPRVMRDWGLGYERLRAINPRLVMLSNTGYGHGAPWSAYRAQGTTLEATMGLSAYSGYAGGLPVKVGQSYPDFLAAWAGLTCLMAALLHRDRTGDGQWIDLGMYQLGAVVIPEALIAVQAGQPDAGRRGNLDWNARLGGVFAAQGKDNWLAVSALTTAHVDALRRVLGALRLPEDGLQDALSAWCATRPSAEATAQLQAAGIPAGCVHNARDLLGDEHLRSRDFLEPVDMGPPSGARWLIGRPYRWHGADVRIRRRAPHYGEDNDAVIGGLLGHGPEELALLRGDGITADSPLNPPRLLPENLQKLVLLGTIKEHDSAYRLRAPDAAQTPKTLKKETT
jgi:crotonobetainyl-CoA:carnitine CoA-transferase CaiB-like acyl-CoA transferase